MSFFRSLTVAFLGIFSSTTMAGKLDKARLGFISGDVQVNGKKAKMGQKLDDKSVVTTNDGKATLLLGMDGVVHIGPESRIEMNKFEASRSEGGEATADLKLKSGKLRALVKKIKVKRKRFKLRTKTATMGVRGSEVMADAAGELNVLSGEASVTTGAGQSTTLGGGQAITVDAGSTGELAATNVPAEQQRAEADAIAPQAPVVQTGEQADSVQSDTVNTATDTEVLGETEQLAEDNEDNLDPKAERKRLISTTWSFKKK